MTKSRNIVDAIRKKAHLHNLLEALDLYCENLCVESGLESGIMSIFALALYRHTKPIKGSAPPAINKQNVEIITVIEKPRTTQLRHLERKEKDEWEAGAA